MVVIFRISSALNRRTAYAAAVLGSALVLSGATASVSLAKSAGCEKQKHADKCGQTAQAASPQKAPAPVAIPAVSAFSGPVRTVAIAPAASAPVVPSQGTDAAVTANPTPDPATADSSTAEEAPASGVLGATWVPPTGTGTQDEVDAPAVVTSAAALPKLGFQLAQSRVLVVVIWLALNGAGFILLRRRFDRSAPEFLPISLGAQTYRSSASLRA
jgi:hypothetical protein